jgi:CLIP-associating protein 1/2
LHVCVCEENGQTLNMGLYQYVFVIQVSSPTIIVERAGSFAWTHRSWRVREEFARTVTSAINLFASTELPLQRAILPPV